MMIRASFEGIISSKLKKKGDIYVLSVRTGRDVIKCLTSIDVSNDLEKGSKVFVDGHYSITNALFPISKIYKMIDNKKILLNPLDDNIIERTQEMSPMTKKQKAKDGTFPAPASLQTREKETEIDFGFKIPEVQPSDFITSTKPVSEEVKMEMKKSSKKKEIIEEPVVVEKPPVENIETSTETTVESSEESVVETAEVDNLMINIPDLDLNTDAETTTTNVVVENGLEQTTPENQPKQTVDVSSVNTETETVTPIESIPVDTKSNIEETVEVPPVTPEKKTILIDDDFDLPLPSFGKPNLSTQTSKIETPKKVVPVTPSVEKKKEVEVKKTIPTSCPPKENKTENKVEEPTTSSPTKFPVRFSSEDLF